MRREFDKKYQGIRASVAISHKTWPRAEHQMCLLEYKDKTNFQLYR